MKDSILWADYPSWRQFSWLYLMAGLMAGRAWLFWKFGFSGWIGWTVGAAVLLGTAAIIRCWAHYEILSTRLVVRNGYTGHEIGGVKLTEVEQVEIRQGPIASQLGIGTVVTLIGWTTDPSISRRERSGGGEATHRGGETDGRT